MAAFFMSKVSRFLSHRYCVLHDYKFYKFQFSSSSWVASCDKMDLVEKNPYYEKYAEKIANLQKNAPKEFVARLEQVSKGVTNKASLAHQLSTHCKQFTASTSSKCSHAQTTNTCRRPQRLLDDLMKVDLIRDRSPEELSKIWQEYHQKQENMIAAVIPAGTYSTIFERSQRFPTFIYPIPRQQGFEFVMAQFSLHECHFTSLINYQVHKEDAPECLTIIHYPEFEFEKGIILMRGEYDKDVLTGREAQCLINQVQLYYNAKEDAEGYKLLETFNLKPKEFQYEHLIKQLENFQF